MVPSTRCSSASPRRTRATSSDAPNWRQPWAEAASSAAALGEAQVRVEEWRQLVADLRERHALADDQRRQAETERAAVIAVLGRRARERLRALGHRAAVTELSQGGNR